MDIDTTVIGHVIRQKSYTTAYHNWSAHMWEPGQRPFSDNLCNGRPAMVAVAKEQMESIGRYLRTESQPVDPPRSLGDLRLETDLGLQGGYPIKAVYEASKELLNQRVEHYRNYPLTRDKSGRSVRSSFATLFVLDQKFFELLSLLFAFFLQRTGFGAYI